ncbi:MAG: hypothetical protein EGP67_10860 [Bacteroidales bacterium]|nr:hypothetical protein [Bacteroidales bacterium]
MGREFEPLRGHKAVAEKWLLFLFLPTTGSGVPPARIRAYRVMEECCRSATMDIPIWDGFVNVNQMARATAEGRLYKSRKIFLQEILHRRFRKS